MVIVIRRGTLLPVLKYRVSAAPAPTEVIMKTKMKFFIYILQCKDNTLYTGSTKDINNRLSQHNNSNGAKYTKYRRPCNLVYSEEFKTRGDAIRRELEIKKLSRKEKLELIKNTNQVKI